MCVRARACVYVCVCMCNLNKKICFEILNCLDALMLAKNTLSILYYFHALQCVSQSPNLIFTVKQIAISCFPMNIRSYSIIALIHALIYYAIFILNYRTKFEISKHNKI